MAHDIFAYSTSSYLLKSRLPRPRTVKWRRCRVCKKPKLIKEFQQQFRDGTGGHNNICLKCLKGKKCTQTM